MLSALLKGTTGAVRFDKNVTFTGNSNNIDTQRRTKISTSTSTSMNEGPVNLGQHYLTQDE